MSFFVTNYHRIYCHGEKILLWWTTIWFDRFRWSDFFHSKIHFNDRNAMTFGQKLLFLNEPWFEDWTTKESFVLFATGDMFLKSSEDPQILTDLIYIKNENDFENKIIFEILQSKKNEQKIKICVNGKSWSTQTDFQNPKFVIGLDGSTKLRIDDYVVVEKIQF